MDFFLEAFLSKGVESFFNEEERFEDSVKKQLLFFYLCFRLGASYFIMIFLDFFGRYVKK